MAERQPWEGFTLCGWPDGCGAWEIDGLGYCLRHISVEDLAEAEQITGMKRCRAVDGDGQLSCTYLAVAGSNPALCPMHRSESLGTPMKRASPGFIESAMAEQLSQIMAVHGERLLNPPPVGDPLDALMRLAAEISEFRRILAEKVASLNMSEWRYAHNRVGEQIRTEVMLYERALERDAKVLINIAKLRIREHKVEIERELVELLSQKLAMALEASGADISGQQNAREVLTRELATYLTDK